jgi:hypothetical protein
MIQFNLLPDVKLEFIKARRMKRMVMSISLAAAGVALVIFGGLFVVVNVIQRQHMSHLDQDIAKGVAQLQAIPDINKVLTVQNQLASLTSLHEQKPAGSRALSYLGKVTPQQASVSEATFDFENNTVSITGSADSLVTVNKFADTLKFTTFTSDANQESQNAFSEVVLTNFAVDDAGATYQLDLKFSPEIFNNTQEVKLKVPDIISTRSQTEKPSDLFQQSAKPASDTSGMGQ